MGVWTEAAQALVGLRSRVKIFFFFFFFFKGRYQPTQFVQGCVCLYVDGIKRPSVR